MGSSSASGCISWNAEANTKYPWAQYKSMTKDTSDGGHNHCRMSSDSGRPWCVLDASPYFAYCDVKQCEKSSSVQQKLTLNSKWNNMLKMENVDCWGEYKNHYLGEQSHEGCVNWNSDTNQKYPWLAWCTRFGESACPSIQHRFSRAIDFDDWGDSLGDFGKIVKVKATTPKATTTTTTTTMPAVTRKESIVTDLGLVGLKVMVGDVTCTHELLGVTV